MRQSIERDKDLQSLELYGHYINLGLAKDIIYEDANNNELKIELWNEDNAYLGVFPQYDAEKYILTTNKEKKTKPTPPNTNTKHSNGNTE